MNKKISASFILVLCVALASLAASLDARAQGNPCVVPDNGSGTVTLPPAGCQYLSPSDVHMIVNGLPPGTTVQLTGIHRDFVCRGAAGQTPATCDFVPSPACETAGGTLGGAKECADSTLQLQLQGTGTLAGWNRTIPLPISFATHVGPRTPFAPVQQFPSDMYRLEGQLPPGDPDFDLLRITAGTGNGLPSPGHTTLTQLPSGSWAVDSFFDITYRIDFIGKPGGHVGGMSGSTTATIRMSTGAPGCVPANCDDGNPCTDDVCDAANGTCTHIAVSCDDGQICTDDFCDVTTGACSHVPANCNDGDPCTIDGCIQSPLLAPECVVPDNGGGTVTLPPVGCDYLSPTDVHQIIDGLPPGTTVQLGAIHKDFICSHEGTAGGVCSFQPPIPGVDCDEPGGSLGGEKECAESKLELHLHGSGVLAGWDRLLNLPIGFETHVAPRAPGNPVQSFDTQMYRLFGQLPPGDPDFDLLRITAGNGFGLPSPGHTTLTQRPNGTWAVDSFFDITYRIDFVGSPGGALAGRSGSTTATIRMQLGVGVGCTHAPVVCDDGNPCTDDSCDPASGGCVFTIDNTNACSDGNACTAPDTCLNGACVCNNVGACTPTVTTYTNSTPVTIPTGPAVIQSQIVVGPGAEPFLNRLRLTTVIAHSNNADLDITLTSPSGTIVTITSDNGGTNDDVFKGTVWDDKANPAGQVPYTVNNGLVTDATTTNLVTLTPAVIEEALGAFYGENPNGTWTLRVSDDLSANGGTLQSWRLELGTLPAQPTFTTTTVANSTPVVLADSPAVTSSTIAVAGAGTQIGRVRVRTFIKHTFPGDLDITLTSPNGTVVTLTTDNGGTSDDIFNGTMWDDKADPGNQVPFSAGTFAASNIVTDAVFSVGVARQVLVPEEALAAFQGEDPNGNWVLRSSDDSTGDTGSLDGWSLEISTTRCSAPCTVTCNDNNPCTSDSCDPLVGCVYTPLDGLCNDNSVCTTNDQCVEGVCVGTPISCDDLDVCTDDTCNATTGCVHTGNNAPCDDGNACTVNDTCGTPPAILLQNFDGVTVPSLPAGWVSTVTAGTNPWTTSAAFAVSAPNAATTDETTTVSDKTLDSPSFVLASAIPLEFDNRYNLESGFDGAVLEISINGGAFTDIVTAGGSFVTGPYNAAISATFGSPIAGRAAWSGASAGFVHTKVNLPAAALGQAVVLRFRVASDQSLAAATPNGQWIDNVQLANLVHSCQPGTPANCDDGNACTADSCAQGLLAPACIVPDNGGGTVTLPPAGCAYLSPSDVHEIINGLPAGTTVQLTGIHRDFVCNRGSNGTPPGVCDFLPSPDCDKPGGALGGNEECADSQLALALHGTGVLAGWNRSVQLPISFQTHVAPRTPGAPVQSFDTDMYRLQGQITGDPDFDLLRITGGSGFGMPSPGHTTLRQQGNGTWAVDSFFDITYRIDFIGKPGGPLGGMSGSTTATIRMSTGAGLGCVHAPISCDDSNPCTTDSCDPVSGCVHTPVSCDDGQICTTDACDPATGLCTHAALNCDDGNACTDDSCIQALVAPSCVVPDNGGGTVTLPPAGCDYLSPQDVHEILDGLPAGTTIEFAANHRDFLCKNVQGAPLNCSFQPPPGICDQPGGSLGGREECSSSSLAMNLHGTGTLAGWDRTIQIPVDFETHVGPRTPGAPFQSFATDMFRLQGQITGDPDFDLLRVTGGTGFGMPSPGHTTLTQRPGSMWAVDSFFDITYRIDFVGAPGGRVAGMSGSTTATIRMQTGSGVGCVHNPTNCDDGNACTEDSCDPVSGCVHTAINCDDSNACTQDACVPATGLCTHTPTNCDDGQICTIDACDPATGLCTHGALNCDDGNACTDDSCIQALVAPACVVPDNGGGTVTLPPAGCEYLSPQDVHEIIDGLPAGTTIQFATIHKDFICRSPQGTTGSCSFVPPPGTCEQAGGALGGHEECSDSSLAMTLHGTGVLTGWNRTILLPIAFETHVGPRTPGAPFQSFDTDMFRLQGQITGDPDFDLLRITGGTAFGMPSPGHTTLTQRPGSMWAVDSFFDITYRIDYIGKPGGPIGGMSGSTTATIRMQTGSGVGCVHTPTNCDDGNACTADSCDPVSGCGHTPGLPPAEADTGVRVNKSGTSAQINWNVAAGATTSDLVSGRLSALPVGPGGGDETCLGNDIAGSSALDATVLPAGTGLWYLVRGGNACGSGPYGFQGFHGTPGAPRLTTTCP